MANGKAYSMNMELVKCAETNPHNSPSFPVSILTDNLYLCLCRKVKTQILLLTPIKVSLGL